MALEHQEKDEWDPISKLNPTTCLRLSGARKWTSDTLCRSLFCV